MKMVSRSVYAILIALATARAVRAQPQIAGCEVFPANNVWNTPIDKLPVDANSAQYVATIGALAPAHPDFGSGLYNGGPIGIPFVTVPGTQPKVPISFQYADESDPGPYPIPSNVPIEGGAQSTGDRHVLVIDKDNCILYETWSSYPQPDGSWQAGSGAIFHLKSNTLRPAGWTSADAAGLAIFPGLVRYDEVASGAIRHAIRFTAPETRNTYLWPGRHEASDLTANNDPPMGQRFRLKSTVNISGFSPTVQVILTALKKYGMILADNGSSWYLSGAPDDRWDNDTLHEIAQLEGSDFEAVDESSLMMQADSGQAKGAATALAVTSVENSASYAKGAVSPGELVTLLGSGFDAETLVTFSGHKAPVIHMSPGQINLVTPYEIAGETSTNIVVISRGVQTTPLALQVVAATPGIFMVMNPDGKVNSTADPAPQGRSLVLYATGAGQTTPPGVDGQMEGTIKLPKPVLPVSVTVGGKTARLIYAGAAPKMIAGMLEVKLQLPMGIKSGSAVQLVLNIGGFTTTVNVAIH
jgi:uncharacterized protein (TIGR03437 family)